MKFQMFSPPGSYAFSVDEAMSTPIKKPKRAKICTPPFSSSDAIFRPRRLTIFDDETEDLLMIRKGVELRSIVNDLGDSLHDEGKDNIAILAMSVDENQSLTTFQQVDFTRSASGASSGSRRR